VVQMHIKTDNCSAYTQRQEVLLVLWMSLFEVRTVLTQHITSFSSTTQTHTPLTKRQCMSRRPKNIASFQCCQLYTQNATSDAGQLEV